MSSKVYEVADAGGIELAVNAWTLDLCEHGGCDSCPQGDGGRMDALVTFLWNCACAVMLAAAYQHGAMAGRPASIRHHYRQRRIEDLVNELQRIIGWAEPVEMVALETKVMHEEVARLRAALAYVAQGGEKYIEVAKNALNEGMDGEPSFAKCLEQLEEMRKAG